MTQFQRGDLVRNVKSPQDRYRGKVGTFIALLPGTFFGKDDENGNAVPEPACDVEYEGETGPYGYPYVAQRVSDLELVADRQAQDRAEIAEGIRRLLLRDDVAPLARMFLMLAKEVM